MSAAQNVGMIPTFREVIGRVTDILHGHGALGLILLDLAPLGRVERTFGPAAYQSLRDQIDPVVLEATDSLREDELLARDEAQGDRFLLFVQPRRYAQDPFRAEDVRQLAERLEELVAPRVARLATPYLRSRTVLEVGYAVILHSPLERAERQVLRLIDDARASAELRRRLRERQEREELVEIIYNRRIWTGFQPIVDMETRAVMGYEGLSRGPRGSDLELPLVLFGLAARHGLIEELERACRKQAFEDWELLGEQGRLFINTVPATVRDATFIGRGVLSYLGPSLSPRLVTLEITEREVIANLNLYREAMHAFTEMGFTFAIDDLGSGYSGLETLLTLGASYFKIDMSLVRDVHEKRVARQIVKAILEMGQEAGATVIAEGVQTREESEALLALGLRYAQGYYFARPIDAQLRPRTQARGSA